MWQSPISTGTAAPTSWSPTLEIRLREAPAAPASRYCAETSPGGFIATDITVADGARRVAIGDLNGDGVPDIAVVSLVYQALGTPSRVSVLLQSLTIRGQFAVSGVHDGPISGNFIAIGDVNGDSRNDIVVNDGPSTLLQRATAPGTFEPVRPLR